MTVEATLLAEADFGARAFANCLPGVGWLVVPESGALIVVDEQLAELARFNRRSTWRGHHWVTPDLKRAALSERDRVSMMPGVNYILALTTTTSRHCPPVVVVERVA